MAFSYDTAIPTVRDFVRLAIGDTVEAEAVFTDDAELDAIITLETATGDALKWYAAAAALGILFTRYSTAGKGKVRKRLDDLAVSWGVEDSAADAVEARIKEWKIKGATLLTPKPKAFQML